MNVNTIHQHTFKQKCKSGSGALGGCSQHLQTLLYLLQLNVVVLKDLLHPRESTVPQSIWALLGSEHQLLPGLVNLPK